MLLRDGQGGVWLVLVYCKCRCFAKELRSSYTICYTNRLCLFYKHRLPFAAHIAPHLLAHKMIFLDGFLGCDLCTPLTLAHTMNWGTGFASKWVRAVFPQLCATRKFPQRPVVSWTYILHPMPCLPIQATLLAHTALWCLWLMHYERDLENIQVRMTFPFYNTWTLPHFPLHLGVSQTIGVSGVIHAFSSLLERMNASANFWRCCSI